MKIKRCDHSHGPRRMITLHVGQAVPWPPAPSGFAQITELRRTKVRLFYRTKTGKPRHALTDAARVSIQQLLFEMDNPYDRGLLRKSKTFQL